MCTISKGMPSVKMTDWLFDQLPSQSCSCTKGSNKIGRAKFCLSCNKNGYFFTVQWAALKKTTFLVQLKQIFGPSYFVRALNEYKKLKVYIEGDLGQSRFKKKMLK